MTTTTALSELTGTYTLDVAHTRIGFSARHAMVTKVRGAFNDFEGQIVVDGDNPSASSAQITIKTESIDTRNEQRNGHIRNGDFLEVDKYPEIRFVSTAVEQLNDERFRLTGDLTIKETTKPISIDFTFEGAVVDPFGASRVGFEGSVTINRKDWGVNWNVALEAGGVLVSEKVNLEFEVSAIKNA